MQTHKASLQTDVWVELKIQGPEAKSLEFSNSHRSARLDHLK